MKLILSVSLLVGIVILLAVTAPRPVPPEAQRTLLSGQIGAGFADVYSSLAPVVAFHESYADYLFDGTAVTVPPDLGTSCEGLLIELARLHLTLLSPREPSSRAPAPASLIRLRGKADAFCTVYGPTIASVAESPEIDHAHLAEASEAGLFVGIFELNGILEETFTEAFDAEDREEDRWAFAVSFALRTLANRAVVDRIDENLLEILFGGSGRTASPFPVPEAIGAAMTELAAFSGRDLTSSESEAVGRLVDRILAHFAFD
ncbi:MAG: hypothetical protein WBC63_00275 [Candidatus Bipolaricaulia bacterium]